MRNAAQVTEAQILEALAVPPPLPSRLLEQTSGNSVTVSSYKSPNRTWNHTAKVVREKAKALVSDGGAWPPSKWANVPKNKLVLPMKTVVKLWSDWKQEVSKFNTAMGLTCSC